MKFSKIMYSLCALSSLCVLSGYAASDVGNDNNPGGSTSGSRGPNNVGNNNVGMMNAPQQQQQPVVTVRELRQLNQLGPNSQLPRPDTTFGSFQAPAYPGDGVTFTPGSRFGTGIENRNQGGQYFPYAYQAAQAYQNGTLPGYAVPALGQQVFANPMNLGNPFINPAVRPTGTGQLTFYANPVNQGFFDPVLRPELSAPFQRPGYFGSFQAPAYVGGGIAFTPGNRFGNIIDNRNQGGDYFPYAYQAYQAYQNGTLPGYAVPAPGQQVFANPMNLGNPFINPVVRPTGTGQLAIYANPVDQRFFDPAVRPFNGDPDREAFLRYMWLQNRFNPTPGYYEAPGMGYDANYAQPGF